jgi:hypothetical protein
MAKTDIQTAVRPPRPARRVRVEAGESGSSTQVQPAAPASRVESIEAESIKAASPPIPFNFFEPRGVVRPRAVEVMDGLPVATLEGPSTAQLDLTPSPVPRVSLVPATGVVDISLVPGPNAVGARNLPTLAARHALGRPRQRGAAPAVTSPPSELPRQAVRAAPKPPRRVRSSQREVVLGLGIGVGLSILLAVGGQALLEKRGPSSSAPASIQTAIPGLLPSAGPEGESLIPAPAVALTDSAPASGRDSAAAPAEAASPASASPARPASQISSRRRALARPRAVSSSKLPSAEPAARTAEPNLKKLPDGPEEPAKTPLSPSESAGLGLDLPP